MDSRPAKRKRTEESVHWGRFERPAQRWRPDRQSNLSELLRSGRHSDLQLKCGGESFNVHKAIVCAQSPVIDRALDSGFQEAKTGVVVIEEFPIDVVRQMVEFLYNGVYNTDLKGAVSSTREEEANAIYLFHLRMNAIADYYDIESLREASRACLQDDLEWEWEDSDQILELLSTARESNGDKHLHGVLGTAAVRHLPQLIKDGTLADHCKDEFDYQLIVACNEKMEANAKFRAKWEEILTPRLRCFLKKFSKGYETVRCPKCNKLYSFSTDSFSLRRKLFDERFDATDNDDSEGPGIEEQRGYYTLPVKREHPLTLSVRCTQCDSRLA